MVFFPPCLLFFRFCRDSSHDVFTKERNTASRKVKEQRRSTELLQWRERDGDECCAMFPMFRFVIQASKARKSSDSAQSLNYIHRVQIVGYFLLVLNPHRPWAETAAVVFVILLCFFKFRFIIISLFLFPSTKKTASFGYFSCKCTVSWFREKKRPARSKRCCNKSHSSSVRERRKKRWKK